MLKSQTIKENEKKPVAIVTGGARNIGWAIVQRLAANYSVIIADLAEPVEPLPNFCRYIRTDVCDPTQVEQLLEQSILIGPLHILVHCAAITTSAQPIQKIQLNEWRRVLEVNLTASFIVTQAAIKYLVPEVGSITLLTSRAGKTGFAALNSSPNGTKAHYCASKAGVISLMKSLAIELAPHIRVNAVAPGPIESDMIPQELWPGICARVPLARLGTPKDIANAVHFLISSDASFITGHVLDVNGGTLMD